MRRASRDCSVETEAACCWSSQKPGRPISCSSSAMRCFRPSGSKVITDPVELDPDLLQLLCERLLLLSLGHGVHPSRGAELATRSPLALLVRGAVASPRRS